MLNYVEVAFWTTQGKLFDSARCSVCWDEVIPFQVLNTIPIPITRNLGMYTKHPWEWGNAWRMHLEALSILEGEV